MFEKISKNENLLHHNEVGAIIQCKDCNRIAIIIQSILYTCDEEEYDYFFELIMNIDLNIEKFLFEIGDKNYVILNTKIENLNMVFDLTQFEYLTDLFIQSKYMKEVHKLLIN